MSSCTYIPNDNGLWCPFDSNLEVLTQRNVTVEEFEQILAFFLLIANYVAGD